MERYQCKPPAIQKIFPLLPHRVDLSKKMVFKITIDSGAYAAQTQSSRRTAEEVLDYLEKLDHYTRGVPKLCILVGFQEGGHDFQFPQWGPVNSKLSSKKFPNLSGSECLHYIIREAKRFHTDCTVHVNFTDVYRNNADNGPLFDYYQKNGLIARDAAGHYIENWLGPEPIGQGYSINQLRNWEDDNGVRRQVEYLFEQLPELIETGVIYTDANGAIYPSWYDGIEIEEQIDVYRRVVSYIRERYNVDVIGEYGFDCFYGYISHGLTWAWGTKPFEGSYKSPMKVPAYITAAGKASQYTNEEMRLFGCSVQLEMEAYHKNPKLAAQEAARNAIPYIFLNTKLRQGYDADMGEACFSDGVKSMRCADRCVIAQEDSIYRIAGGNGNSVDENTGAVKDDNDFEVFIPLVWRKDEVMAYSDKGGTREWVLPPDWSESVSAVDVYEITSGGLDHANRRILPVLRRRIKLTIAPGQLLCIVPTGADVEHNEIGSHGSRCLYLGVDTTTQGDWIGRYGKEGFCIEGGEDTLGDAVRWVGSRARVFEFEPTDRRALRSGPAALTRVAAAQTSQLHQIVAVDTNGREQCVSLYLVDFAYGRAQTLIEVLEAGSGELLSSCYCANYEKGRYVNFNINGKVDIRLTRIYGEDLSERGPAALAGVFFDPPMEASEVSLQPNIYEQPRLLRGEEIAYSVDSIYRPAVPTSVAEILGRRAALSIKAVSRNNGKLSYRWQRSANGQDWADIADGTEETLVFEKLSEADLMEYRCIVTDQRLGWSSCRTTSQSIALKQ